MNALDLDPSLQLSNRHLPFDNLLFVRRQPLLQLLALFTQLRHRHLQVFVLVVQL